MGSVASRVESRIVLIPLPPHNKAYLSNAKRQSESVVIIK